MRRMCVPLHAELAGETLFVVCVCVSLSLSPPPPPPSPSPLSVCVTAGVFNTGPTNEIAINKAVSLVGGHGSYVTSA